MYNDIVSKLNKVEEPLLRDKIHKIDTVIQPGIKELKWQSSNIDEFIRGTMLVVKDVNNIVTNMKNNLEKMESILKGWAKKPLVDRKAKPMNPEEFIMQHMATVSVKHNDISLQAKEIAKLLKDTSDNIKMPKTSKEWKSYVDYVNEIIIEGLAHVIKESMN